MGLPLQARLTSGASSALTIEGTYVMAYARVRRCAMTAVSATSARANLYRLIDQVNEESEPLTITGQRGNAVLVGEDDWRAIQETLFLESTARIQKDTMA